MPNLLQLITSAGGDATLVEQPSDNPIVEPIGGPSDIDSLMDRFPENVYHKGRDTHLYRLLTALCGDAGAGLIKKQAFVARLFSEAEIVNFEDLDKFYAGHFKFKRL